MISFERLLALPATVLTLLAAFAVDAQGQPWPYELPQDHQYSLEHEDHFKRELDIQQRLKWHAPSVIKKMSGRDAGEKFYLQYFAFGGLEDEAEAVNTTTYLRAPIALHTNHDRPHISLFGRSLFGRNFKCPGNTTSCSSIDSDLCCSTGDSCVSLSGNIGCCPPGETCTETVETCDTAAGYTSCPNSTNGGCCVPGAACQGTGCVYYGTTTIIATGTTITVRTSASISHTSSDGSTVIVPAATSQYCYTTTVTVTESGRTTTIVSVTTITPTSSASSASTSIITTTAAGSSATASAAVRPTSVSSETSISVAVAPSSTSNGFCPTGYYQCSAYYLGGCCQVGRNCDTTSCPPTPSTTIVSSGATIVVPAAASASETQGSCAGGWYTCAASAGGGCCPSRYVCGTSSCSATIGGEQNTAKQAPSSANVLSWAWSFFVIAVGTGIGMVCL
ncbi:hypothetical protein EJ03DRAFT_80111 [Teratosphaeria nubilosa]|uniref:GPI anchored protein n=1 Tax=Teratosphaeria nubilosa TaxID=161662 RepID=A0A6G1LB00_9PEZI|nr:hypothetical protein EJ03DRAFT_80111 [Teratosphaeria nubilosa]